jgi:phosphoribosyl 1,2-cyclic phosphate phosphodiesterase
MKTKMNNTNKNSLIILGSGTSTGIPLIGCHCHVCTSLDHRDLRLRTSVLIHTKNKQNILVDTSPDLRTQMLNNKISALDAIIITHEHADHLHGLDDVRPFCFMKPNHSIPVYTNSTTKQIIETRFPYIFNQSKPLLGGGLPKISLHEVPLMQEVKILGETFIFFNYPHGHGETMGFLHDKMAYVVDCMMLPDDVKNLLKKAKLDLLIIDCLQRKEHTTHLTVERSFDLIDFINPNSAGLIHMGHDLSHRVLDTLAKNRFKNKNVFPVYDQLQLQY